MGGPPSPPSPDGEPPTPRPSGGIPGWPPGPDRRRGDRPDGAGGDDRVPRPWPGATAPPGAGMPPGSSWAGLAPRFAATLIDLIVVGVAWFVAAELFILVISATGSLDLSSIQPPSLGSLTMTDQEFRLGVFLVGIWVAVRGLYLVYAWSRFGATLGNQLLRLRVLDARTGGRISTGRAALRWFVAELPAIGLLLDVGILLWYAAIVVSIARDPHRRGVHDRAAGSVMVRHRAGDAHGQGGLPV
jgi:uncharacterized RDD family membrane protein YckC